MIHLVKKRKKHCFQFVFPGLSTSLLMVSLLSACSNKDVYQIIQHNQMHECDKLINIQREQCIAQNKKSYEEYKREREEIVND